MSSVAGRRIVLGVTGGIAAFKSVDVCRRLVEAGAHVSPVLTEGALNFVGRTTFDALASEPVQMGLFSASEPIPHTRLGQNADLVLVCPATARVLSDYRTGRSADLLTATMIATRAPVVVCPAMHTEMWEHPAVQDNIETLRSRGVTIVGPVEGRLAGGDSGAGRLAEPEDIVAAVGALLAPVDPGPMAGLKVLVTAGGTREAIDPVRFLGNRSSGKQGLALATEAASRGAMVTLVSTVEPGAAEARGDIDVVRVETASEMHAAVEQSAPAADIVIMAAAVADYRPRTCADGKIKKTEGGLGTIELVETPDILAGLSAAKRPGQTLVGFAAETSDLRAHAAEKLATKGADLIVGNDVSAPGVGFEHDTNAVVIVSATTTRDIPLSDKREIARAVLDATLEHRTANNR